jgi:hypothetical protein
VRPGHLPRIGAVYSHRDRCWGRTAYLPHITGNYARPLPEFYSSGRVMSPLSSPNSLENVIFFVEN